MLKPSSPSNDGLALTPPLARSEPGEGRKDLAYWEPYIVWGLIAVTLLLTSLTYIFGYFIVPPGMRFIGTAYNIDDFCNYLSWLRQNADGYFFYHNLFTTDPQKNLEFNIFFYFLGRLMHYGHLPPQAVWHLARVGGGLALLGLIYRFYRHCLPTDPAARLTAFGFVCLSSGFGWVSAARWQDRNVPGSPVDAWQPEAYTFLSLDTSALFVVSTLLILGTLYALLRGEETGRWRYPVVAGVCGAVLGNMHSYDVLHLSAAWGLFLVVWTLRQRGRGVALSWARGLLALALTMPTTLYQLYIFNVEATFHKRANVPTLSPALWHYALGYGLVFVFALIALARLPRDWRREGRVSRPLLFAACWAIGGFMAAYLPLAFQRKMLMGEHIPLCLLAGIGAAALVRRWVPRPRLQAAVLALLVLATFPSNALFLGRDLRHLEANTSETELSPFLPDTLYDAYNWIHGNLSPRQDAVLGLVRDCAPLPGATDRVVWCGHWGETPEYGTKVIAFLRFADSDTPDDQRRAFLAAIPATYLLYPNADNLSYVDKKGRQYQLADFSRHPPAYLQTVYRNTGYTVFHIVLAPKDEAVPGGDRH